MIALSIIFAIIAVFLSACYWIQTRSRFAKLLNEFPLVGSITPVLGNVKILSADPEILFTIIRKYAAIYTETYGGWGAIYGTLHVVTADDAEIILSNVKHIEKGIIYSILQPWLQTGLLTSGGTKWHHRRKMLTPAFHYNILKMYVEVFGEQCKKITKTLSEECKNTKTNIKPIITDFTLRSICEAAMGMKFDKNDENQESYYKALRSLVPILIKRIVSPWFYLTIIFIMTPMYWSQRKLVNILHKFTTNVIKKREETFKDSDVADLDLADKKSKKRLAMLDLLIYAKRHLGTIDDEGIREEVDTFVFEGHDTTSVGICFALLLLAYHEDVQDKIIAELDEIFGSSKREATYDDLQNMKYLERCIKECLRIYPSVPMVIRNLSEDTPLTHHVAPAGSEVFIHIYNIHRDPKYFPDPEKYDPDRFLPENSIGRHPYAYIPFSAGPRNCIGQKFAMLELKSIISSILRSFKMEPVDSPKDLTFVVDLVLRTNSPIHIKFKPRL